MNKWTIILLVSAENNLINESVKAIEEIYQVQQCDEVTFLIIFDGLEFGKFSSAFAKPSLYKVNCENGFFIDKPEFVHRSENLASKATLEDFLRYIKDNFKAENYGFVYKGHGGSGETDISSGVFIEKPFSIPASIVDDDEKIKEYIKRQISKKVEFESSYLYRGFAKSKSSKQVVMVIFRRKTESTAWLTYKGIASCIKTVFKEKIGFVCLDCCWGQQIENAFAFADVAENFIASVDESPALGIGYTEICKKIVQRPDIIPEEIANMIVAVYYYRNYNDYDSTDPEFRKMGVSMTNISTRLLAKNESNAGNSFQEKMREFCDYVIPRMSTLYSIITQARKKCKDYTYANTEALKADQIIYPIFNIDLPWFLTNLKFYNKEKDMALDKLISELLMKIEYDLITGYLGSNYKKPVLGGSTAFTGGNGLSIVFPISKKHADDCESLFSQTKLEFYVATNWRALLNAYYDALEDSLKSVDMKLWTSFNTESFSFPLFKVQESYEKSGHDQTDFTFNKFKTEISKDINTDESEEDANWGRII